MSLFLATERQLGLLMEQWNYDASHLETRYKNNKLEVRFNGGWIDNPQAEQELEQLIEQLENNPNECFCDDMDPSNYEIKDREEVADYGITIAGFGAHTALNDHQSVKVCKLHNKIMDSADQSLSTKALKRFGLR